MTGVALLEPGNSPLSEGIVEVDGRGKLLVGANFESFANLAPSYGFLRVCFFLKQVCTRLPTLSKRFVVAMNEKTL